MILQELASLYARLLEDPDVVDIAPAGWSRERVAWEVVINDAGTVLGVVPLSTGEGKKLKPYRELTVPAHTGRSGKNPAPYFLCDNAKYLFGMDEKAGERRFSDAHALHEEVLAECDAPAAKAVLAFFRRGSQADCLDEADRTALAEGRNIVFRHQESGRLVHELSSVRDAWDAYRTREQEGIVEGQCAVTGKNGPLARLFPQVTGVPGAQSSGASLVSFNFPASESYGKSQAYNASISEDTAFAAGSALKYLMADPGHCIRMGGNIVVFWADRKAVNEDRLMFSMLGGVPAAEDGATLQHLGETFSRMRGGLPIENEFDLDVGYCVLGISPNAARLSVRFFERSTLGALAKNFAWYLRDIDMVGLRTSAIGLLLLQTAAQGKRENLPSTLVNSSYTAMLTGAAFPMALHQLVLSRMRADHGQNNSWDMSQRAALLKACLVRRQRLQGEKVTEEERIDMALNQENANPAYLWGRLFAVMERAQQAAVGDTNATIVDRYVGAACTTPQRVFGLLYRGCRIHMGTVRKKKPGLAIKLEKEIDEIMEALPGDGTLPRVLDSDGQAAFFIAYHQERESLWPSKGAKRDNPAITSDDGQYDSDKDKE